MRNLLAGMVRRPHAYRLGIGPASAVLLPCSAWRANSNSAAAEQVFSAHLTDPWETLSAALLPLFGKAGRSSRPLSIVIADQWARLFIVTPARNTSSLQDCKAAAAMRFQTLYGESASGWQISAHWHARDPFVACAVPTKLLTALHALAASQHLHLVSVVPHFVAGWNRWCRKLNGTAWFGVVEDKWLSMAAMSHGRLHALRTLALPGHAWRDPHWLPAELSRQALIINSPIPQMLHVCGAIPDWPADAAQRPDLCTRLTATHSSLPAQLTSAAAHMAWAGGAR
jgi:hypothetical protein